MIKKYFRWFYAPIMKAIRNHKNYNDVLLDTKRLDLLAKESTETKSRVFYLGITQHSNMGDMAQHYCIKKWIFENYPDSELVMFEATTVIDNRFGFLKMLKSVYRPNDIIVFQSGYTTTDLGGYHDEMHRRVIDCMPEARILMMPQTIYFAKQKNRKRTSEFYDKAKHMLFLSRDNVSFQSAKVMFPHVKTMAFPDIVTTLIGTFDFNHERKGVCLCSRNDSEKFYSESELTALINDLSNMTEVTVTDTTIKESYITIRNNLRYFIEHEIERYSHYQVVITDRYHGTIFSLAAATPVIIIKTTDHKVITGADWFKGIYDGFVYVAKDLKEARILAKTILSEKKVYKLEPYFKDQYYSKLKSYFESV